MKKRATLQKLLLITQLLLGVLVPTAGLANMPVIRVALLDNVNDPYLPAGYSESYLAGVKAAVLAAKDQGYTIQYKTFFYDNAPLAVLNQVPAVNAWEPDLIIGPHSSNQLLLLKPSFKSVMVISPYASDSALAELPSNFYSLALLDHDLGHAVIKFLSGEFPNKGLVNVVAADCKDCVDLTNIINSGYKNIYPSAKIVTNMYSGESDNVSVAKLTSNYQDGDIILLQPNTSLELQQLMYRIATQLGNNPIFINNLDNLGNPNKMPKNISYVEYWFTTYLFDNNSPDFQQFSKYYQVLYGNSSPDNPVSYTVYLTIVSAVKALHSFPSNNSGDMRTNILSSYNKARQTDPHWYKTSTYAIYKIDPQTKELIGTISAFN